MVYVDEIRITTPTQIAGREAPTHDEVVKGHPKSVREQFPGRAAYVVRPIPEGPLPAFIFVDALVCQQPVSDFAADSFRVVVSWSSDDVDSSPPELIEREISDVELVWKARPTGSRTPAETMRRNCCYDQCSEPGAIHIGRNGGDSHWICFYHFDTWHAQRARFLVDGLGSEMEQLGELLKGEE